MEVRHLELGEKRYSEQTEEQADLQSAGIRDQEAEAALAAEQNVYIPDILPRATTRPVQPVVR